MLLIGFTTCLLQAQKAQLFSGNVPNQNAIELKWMGKEINLENSYNLYRREKGGTWQKINNQVIKKTTPLTEAEIKAEAEKPNHNDALLIYSNAFQKSDNSTDNIELNNFVLNILSATQNELANYMGNYFIDTTISVEKNYEYRLTLSGKNADNFIAEAIINANSYQQPISPSNFSVLAKDKLVQLKWNPDKQFSQYKIFRSSTSNGKTEATLTALLSEEQVKDAFAGKYFFEDKDSLLVNEKKYYYKICGIDFFGHESKLSVEQIATPKDYTAPKKVYGFKTELKGKTVVLNWFASKDTDCMGYNVYKSLNEKEGFVKINSSILPKTDQLFTDKDVKEGIIYFYYLEATDKNGNGSKTDIASYVLPDMTPPSIPKNLKATSEIGKINITWDKNVETDLEGYYIFRALKNEETNFQLLNDEPLKENKFIDILPKEAGNYFLYRICAVDKNYNRSNSSAFIASKMPDIVVPSAVVLISAELKENKVQLQWSQNRERDIKGYEVWKAETDAKFKPVNPQKISDLKTLTYIDERIINNKNVLYYIIAVDSAGNKSIPSNKKIVSQKMKREINKAVDNLRGVYDTNAKKISITWAESSVGNSQQYKVYRKTDNRDFIPISKMKKATSFTDTTIEVGKTYYYKVLSISMNTEDVYSNEVKVNTR